MLKHDAPNLAYGQRMLVRAVARFKRVQNALGGKVFLDVHILDLRPRLAVEKRVKMKA